MDKSLFQKLDTIDNNGKLIGEVWYKPHTTIIICGVIAILLIFTRNIAAIILALCVAVIVFFVNTRIKDHKALGVYDEYVLVYFTDDPEYARKINYSDIAEWTCKNGTTGDDAMMFQLADGELVYKNTFQISKAMRLMNKVLPDKESKKVQEMKNKEKKLKFDWPFKKRK